MGDYYVRSALFVLIFLLLTPVALATSAFALITISQTADSEPVRGEVLASTNENLINAPVNGVAVFASLPSNKPAMEISTNIADARALIIKNYLRDYNSPLLPYSEQIVKTADKYGVDFRLITAIAQQESNLCKRIPPNTHNCWGWGIHSRGTLGFESYEEGIETVTKGLSEEYLGKGYVTVDDIMGKYTPLSNGSWANGVSTFMQEMQ